MRRISKVFPGRACVFGAVINSIIVALVCLAGCDKTDAQKTTQNPVAANTAEKPGEARTPNYHGLIQEYQAVLSADPHNLAAIIALGNAYFESGEWKQANMMYAYALLIDPKNADVRTDMGTAYRHRGMTAQALAEYKTALEHDPEHLDARYNMGLLYANGKERQAAIRVWEELLERAPNYPHAAKIKSDISAFEKTLKKDAE